MADADPNITSRALEGPYSIAREIAEQSASLPPIGPPTPPLGGDRLVLIRRSVLEALIEHEVEAAVAAIAVIDDADGDTDREEIGVEDSFECHTERYGYMGPGCPVADAHDDTWVEWSSMTGSAKRGPNFTAGPEDAEDDEGGGDDAQSEDEPGFDPSHRRWANKSSDGAGCKISDSDFGVDDVGEEIGEEEIEQMVGDVPCLPVFEIEPNPFDGKRKHLGMSNLLTPFVSNGGKVRSADTGNEHRLFGRTEGPGTVV